MDSPAISIGRPVNEPDVGRFDPVETPPEHLLSFPADPLHRVRQHLPIGAMDVCRKTTGGTYRNDGEGVVDVSVREQYRDWFEPVVTEDLVDAGCHLNAGIDDDALLPPIGGHDIDVRPEGSRGKASDEHPPEPTWRGFPTLIPRQPGSTRVSRAGATVSSRSTRQRKEVARRKYEKYQERKRAEAARKRHFRIILAVIVIVALLIAATFWVVSMTDNGEEEPQTQPGNPLVFSQPEQVLAAGTSATATLQTNKGTITFDLNTEQAPKNSNSLAFPRWARILRRDSLPSTHDRPDSFRLAVRLSRWFRKWRPRLHSRGREPAEGR